MNINASMLKKLIREEIRSLMQDDALFGHSESPGIVPDWENLKDKSLPRSCPVCGTAHDGPCHNPSLDPDGDGRNLSYGHTKSSDDEGRSTKKQLYYISRKSQSLHDLLEDEDDLPEWVQSKVSRAAEKIQSVYDYLEHKIRTRNY